MVLAGIMSSRRRAGCSDRRGATRRGRPALAAPGLAATLCLALLAGIAPGRARAECPHPAPIVAFDAQTFYADRQGSIVDRSRLNALQANLQPIRDFLYQAGARADSALAKGDSAAGECAAAMMRAWAAGAALTAPSRTNEEAYDRIQMVYALSAIDRKLRAATPSRSSATVDAWIARLAHQSIADFARFHEPAGNLHDWLAASAASVAAASGDAGLRAYAADAFSKGLTEIDNEGWLLQESQRGQRALLYHAYALDALVLAQSDLTGCMSVSCSRPALVRLYRRVIAGLQDDSAFRARTAVAQERPEPKLWIPICEYADPARPPSIAAACRGAQRFDTNLGGDVHLLLAATVRGKPAR